MTKKSNKISISWIRETGDDFRAILMETVFQIQSVSMNAAQHSSIQNGRSCSKPSQKSLQVKWGSYGSVAVGDTHRRLSFFVMVLCHSRIMYVAFTVRGRTYGASPHEPAAN